jgi:hypothetical protein
LIVAARVACTRGHDRWWRGHSRHVPAVFMCT